MVKIRHYCFRCVDGDYTRQLVRELSCEAARVLLKLNEFGIGDWNGFKGPHPKNVSDGIMFRLEGNVNDGKRIHAEGSANFPKHFHEFTGWINKELQNAEEA